MARWDNEDRAKLMAHMLEKSEQCSLCGTATWEWLADPEAYVTELHDCRGCYLKDAAQPAIGENRTAGQSVILMPRAEHERKQRDPATPKLGPTIKKRTRPPKESR